MNVFTTFADIIAREVKIAAATISLMAPNNHVNKGYKRMPRNNLKRSLSTFSGPSIALSLHCRTVVTVAVLGVLVSGCDNRYQTLPACDVSIPADDFGRFTYDEKGSATDMSSGITWYRCPAGSYFERDTCTGEAFRLDWDSAIEYTAELSEISGLPWRMASLEEVKSIIVPGCVGPALNPQIFPTIEPVNLWTLSQRDQNDNLKCTIYTYNGAFNCRHVKTTERPFMLVKDEDLPTDLDALQAIEPSL